MHSSTYLHPLSQCDGFPETSSTTTSTHTQIREIHIYQLPHDLDCSFFGKLNASRACGQRKKIPELKDMLVLVDGSLQWIVFSHFGISLRRVDVKGMAL